MGEERLPARIAGKPSWLISEVSRLSHQLLTDKLGTAGSRGYHARLLAALDEFGPLSQASLGRHTGLDPSDVVAALNDLTARGLVSRSRDPADARRNIVTLTAPGAEHLELLDRLLGEVQDELLAPLSAPERAELVRLLDRMLDRGLPASPGEAAGRRPDRAGTSR
ncbi:MAG TPA: MarR family winged helix-turn-helix transcriptional regulator [Streptosporangiaceae bacterium]|jgi:DNA-binding MarR family transcriptional regulator